MLFQLRVVLQLMQEFDLSVSPTSGNFLLLAFLFILLFLYFLLFVSNLSWRVNVLNVINNHHSLGGTQVLMDSSTRLYALFFFFQGKKMETLVW